MEINHKEGRRTVYRPEDDRFLQLKSGRYVVFFRQPLSVFYSNTAMAQFDTRSSIRSSLRTVSTLHRYRPVSPRTACVFYISGFHTKYPSPPAAHIFFFAICHVRDISFKQEIVPLTATVPYDRRNTGFRALKALTMRA
jgi:hypothetical protein